MRSFTATWLALLLSLAMAGCGESKPSKPATSTGSVGVTNDEILKMEPDQQMEALNARIQDENLSVDPWTLLAQIKREQQKKK